MVLYYFYSCAWCYNIQDEVGFGNLWRLEELQGILNMKSVCTPNPKYILTMLDLVNNCQEMCDVICMMLSEVKKRNGEEYPASSLSDVIVMLNVYMKKQEVDVNLLSWCV